MVSLKNLLELFLMDQKLNGNTDKTIYNYERFITYFIDFLGPDATLNDVTIFNVKQYQLYLLDKDKVYNFTTANLGKLSKTTVQTYMRNLRVFLNWLHTESYLEENIAKKLKLPKAPKKVIEILSDDEIQILYKKLNENTEFGLRNKCIVSLMLDSGLRLNEVITLNVENIHFTQGVVKVTGKGNKERIVPLGLYTKKLLFKYLNGFRPMTEYPTYKIFISKDKLPITYDSVKMIFYRLKRSTGIKRLYPHMLRHTFATRYLINGGDVFSLQQILGHTSLEMTRRYSHLASSYVTANFKMLSPLDNLRANRIKI